MTFLIEDAGGDGERRWRVEMEVGYGVLPKLRPEGTEGGRRAPRTVTDVVSGDVGVLSGTYALFEALVVATRPAWGRVTNQPSVRSGLFEPAPRVGWLTYLPRHLALPMIPPPARVMEVAGLGWILIARSTPPSAVSAHDPASLAYVRYALGARVLLDGPAYPPPAPEVVAPAPPDIAVAPAQEVPSYLKAPPTGAEQRSTGDATAAPAVVASSNEPSPLTPFSSGTASIDVSKILRPAVPFEPGSPGAAAATEPRGAAPPPPQASPPPRPPPAAGAQSVGGTEEFNLDALMKRPRPVPFEATGPRASAPAAAPDRPETHRETGSVQDAAAAKGTAAQGTAPQRRLVRFDPQTGQPLAQPYWEELPALGKKVRAGE